jgi:hypothetical protein
MAMSDWTSVEDRLPEDEGRYAILYMKAGKWPTPFVADYYPRDGWSSEMFGEPITHWTTFPELPK